MEDRVALRVGDLVRETGIRALLEPGSRYQVGIVLSVDSSNAVPPRKDFAAKVKWSDDSPPMWHTQKILEKISD